MIVATVRNVPEESLHDRGRNDVPHIVRLRIPLESDADNLAVLNDRAARVSRIDRGIDLDDEMGVRARVTVVAEVDP